MKIITWLKRNAIARAVYSLYKNYLDFGWFGYIADNVIITPPPIGLIKSQTSKYMRVQI